MAARAHRVAERERIFQRGRAHPRWVTFRPVQRIVVGRGVGAAAGIVLGVAIAACGDDVTTFMLPEEEASPLEPEPTASRTFEVLSEQSSLDVVCRFIGVSSVAGTAGADRAACASAVEDCRSNVEAVLGSDGEAPPLGLPPTDLEALLGCPLTLPELDGCIAAALERGIDQYGSSIGCDMPALPAVNTLALFASVDCIGVALQCPELIASLAGQ